MLYIFYLILLFQLYYIQSIEFNKSNTALLIILIMQLFLYIILFNKNKPIINIKNLKFEIIYKNYKYGLLLLLSFYILCYSLLLLYQNKTK